MNNYESLPLATTIFHKNSHPIFGEVTVQVSIDDNAGGPFVVIKQMSDNCKIELDMEQLELIVVEARKLVEAHEANVEGDL